MPVNTQWPKWWQWPNLLALDASLVGVGWLMVLVKDNYIQIGIAAPLVLGLSIWLVYTADRWLDVRKLPLEKLPTARHRFIKQWAKPLFAAWAIALALDIVTALLWLSFTQILSGLLVVTLALVHTVLSQKQTRLTIPKELRISLIYMAGAGAFLTDYPDIWLKLLLPLCLFGLLCFINCGMIASKEIEFDAIMGRRSIANSSGFQTRYYAIVALLTGILAISLPIYYMSTFVAIAGSCLGLLLLGVFEQKLNPERFRVLADAILLIPWLLL